MGRTICFFSDRIFRSLLGSLRVQESGRCREPSEKFFRHLVPGSLLLAALCRGHAKNGLRGVEEWEEIPAVEFLKRRALLP